jgi:hypothetical protein
VLLGNGDGTYQYAVNYAADDGPEAIVINDLNNDNIPDIAVANRSSNNVSVFLGKGVGLFNDAIHYAAGEEPHAIISRDINRDNKVDLVVLNDDHLYRFDNYVSVLLGNGDGTFQEPNKYRAGERASSMAMGDLNRDGCLDLATANNSSSPIPHVAVLFSKCDGTFKDPVSHEIELHPTTIKIAEITGDIYLDIIVAGYAKNYNMHVLKGGTSGAFRDIYKFSAADVDNMALGDMNNDKTKDVVMLNHNSGDLSLLFNTTGQPSVSSDFMAPILMLLLDQ